MELLVIHKGMNIQVINFLSLVFIIHAHNFIVIGQKVNMAARLMMKFPNLITCDETTKTKSALPSKSFHQSPPVKLKGITNPENVYFF